MEENIFKAIQNVDINVDREELIKALKYDRDQYNKGYEDAKAEIKNTLYDRLMNISKEPESISKSARLSLIKCIIEEMEKEQ